MSRAPKWYPFDWRKGYRQKRPPERKDVLVRIAPPIDGSSPTGGIAVGYLRYASGDRNCPKFIVPFCGLVANPQILDDPSKGDVIAWCDCLDDEVIAEGWKLGNERDLL